MHRDKYNIIGQIQEDGVTVEGGDSVCWMGHWIYLNNNSDWSVEDFISTFEVAPGGWVRHPHKEQTYHGFGAFYKGPWQGVISRDQLTGILAGLMKAKSAGPILRLIKQHSKRLFLFSYNTIHNGAPPEQTKWKLPDLTLFDIWAMELRALGNVVKWLKPVLYPILTILDLHMLVNTMLVNKDPSEEDRINYAIKLITSNRHNPTLISKLSYKLCNKVNLLTSIKKYWCGWRDNCEFYPLYEKALGE